jgi:hypothetical protein
MKTETAAGSLGRAVCLLRAFAVLLCAAAAGGCSFLEDEFTWLDRTGPTAAPDAPVSATTLRP